MDVRADLDACLDLTTEDIARLVLCLLVEEMLRGRLAAFRSAPHLSLARVVDPAMVASCERHISP